MPLKDADILFGKLALGRSYLTRAQALQVVAELDGAPVAAHEAFSAAAVRLGVLDLKHASELAEVLTWGELVCRGRCPDDVRVPLAEATPTPDNVCARCGGPVYVAQAAADDAAAAPTGSPKTTFMELEVDADLREMLDE